jgi:universal stress protein A
MTILIATDFSMPAFTAYRYAAALALRLKAQLLVVNVLPAGMTLHPEYPVYPAYLKQLHEEWKVKLEQFRHRVQQDQAVFEIRQVSGDPGDCIVDIADEVKAALIVMGTYGRTGFDRLLLGSTAEKVVRWANCPGNDRTRE